jgi:MFS family permease
LSTGAPKLDPYASFRRPAYRAFLYGSLLRNLGSQALTVTAAWHLYERTNSAWALAAIGFCNYLPIFLFSLPAGGLADHYDRRRVLFWATSLELFAYLGLAWLAFSGAATGWWYLFITLAATARAVGQPSGVSLYPLLMAAEEVPTAVTWGSANYQIGAIGGPILGALVLHAAGPAKTLLLASACPAAYLWLLGRMHLYRPQPLPDTREPLKQRLLEGFRFVRAERAMYASLSLDFVAVLFGGVEGIMPIFARDFLGCGEIGYGLLKAAPFAGNLAMSLYLAHRPPLRKPGRDMLVSVGLFGACMGVFAVSRLLWLSLAALFASGVLDQVSVYVRQTLVQLRTPEALRGRVQAVNFLFIGSSNELGEFESGATAALVGPVASVLLGAGAVLLFVVAWSAYFPALRQLPPLEHKA